MKYKGYKDKTIYKDIVDSLMMIAKPCSVCGETYEGFGNNAQPINSGRCCDKCNTDVIVERITSMILNSRKFKSYK